MSEQSFHEFPDPVVGAYLEKVRSLTDAQFAALNGPKKRLVRWNVPVSWLLAPVAVWLRVRQRLLRRALRYLAMGGCQDSKALHEYKVFYAHLAHRGCTDVGEMRIGRGLQLLRIRDTIPTAAEEYRRLMGQFVPTDTLGWTAHEASA